MDNRKLHRLIDICCDAIEENIIRDDSATPEDHLAYLVYRVGLALGQLKEYADTNYAVGD